MISRMYNITVMGFDLTDLVQGDNNLDDVLRRARWSKFDVQGLGIAIVCR
jgi:hypothetical protein